MKKNKKFSVKLFGEMMRQQRTMAIVLLSICLVITVLSVVSAKATWENLREYAPEEYSEYTPFSTVSSVSPILLIFMYAGGLLLPLVGFGFQNKRVSSDFYHAIPITRTALFTSTVAASLVWSLITIFSTLAVEIAGHLMFGMTFHYAFLPPLITSLICGVFLMSSITTLAMSVTGSGFSNFIVAGLILVLPRFILGAVTLVINGASDILYGTTLSFLLDASYNILIGPIVSVSGRVLTSMSAEGMYSNIWTYVYSFALGLIYLGLALLASNKRCSEMAGFSAPGKKMQHIYRCALALPPILVLAMLIMLGEMQGIMDAEELIVTLILVILSLFTYFLFELITTKSFKKMLKCAPYFLVVIAVSLLISGVASLVTNIEQNKTLEVSDIAAVSKYIEPSNYMWGMEYREYMMATISIDDDELAELTSNALKRTVDIINGKSKEYPSIDAAYNKLAMTNVRFICNGGSTLIRKVFFTSAEYQRYEKIFAENPQYKAQMLATPSKDEIISLTMNVWGIDHKERWDLWETYTRECAEASKSDSIIQNGKPFGGECFFVQGVTNGLSFNSAFYISPIYMPETFNKMVGYVNAQYETIKASGEADIVFEGFLNGFEIIAQPTTEEEKYDYSYDPDKWGNIRLTLYEDTLKNTGVELYGQDVSSAMFVMDIYSYYSEEHRAKTQELVGIIQNAKLATSYSANVMIVEMAYSYLANEDDSGMVVWYPWEEKSVKFYVDLGADSERVAEILGDMVMDDFMYYDMHIENYAMSSDVEIYFP